MFKLTEVQPKSDQKIPGQAAVYVAKKSGGNGIINVIDDFRFTGSNLTPYLKNRIPYLVLFEYDVKYNSYISSAMYSMKLLQGDNALGGIAKGVGELAQSITTYTEKILKDIKDKIPGDKSNNAITQLASGTIEKAADLTGTMKDIGDILKTNGEFSNPVLAPYNHLYIREPSDFTYIFPYFGDKKRDVNVGWSASDSGSLAGKSGLNSVVQAGKELIDTYYGVSKMASPGAFVEVPKFYNYDTDGGDTINVTFDLVNTIDKEDYKKNFLLTFLLTYQNLPYRKDLATVTPPKIYRCIFPGEQELPYCYISNINISFLGSRRILKVPSVVNGNLIDTIIPDAYRVELTIKSLIPSTANLMLANNNVVSQ